MVCEWLRCCFYVCATKIGGGQRCFVGYRQTYICMDKRPAWQYPSPPPSRAGSVTIRTVTCSTAFRIRVEGGQARTSATDTFLSFRSLPGHDPATKILSGVIIYPGHWWDSG